MLRLKSPQMLRISRVANVIRAFVHFTNAPVDSGAFGVSNAPVDSGAFGVSNAPVVFENRSI